jgi:hypothetical protein
MGSRTLNIHERFLRHIWNRQYLRRDELHTTDGLAVRVLDAGTLNPDGGPDVRDAVIQIGQTTYSGDVEIHRTLIDWVHHRHHVDPRYNRVILHVVLERPSVDSSTTIPTGRQIPVLLLEPFLSESIHLLWQKAILDERLHSRNDIPCAGRNHTVSGELLADWIQRLSVERLELKLRRFDERLRELAHIRLHTVREQCNHNALWRIEGNPDDLPAPQRECSSLDLAKREHWDQLLYEGLMEGLGYSKNREPFVRLCRSVTLREFRRHHIEDNDVAIQALLLGAAGLLPRVKGVHDAESRAFVRTLAREWKARKKEYRSAVLHLGHWQFFPTRPSNFPTLRIAAATVLVQKILREDLFRVIIEILKTTDGGMRAFTSIRELLAVEPLPFWRNHYHFDHRSAKPTQPLGPERRGDLVVNTIVPLALLYARVFKDRLVRERVISLFSAAPRGPDNSITRLMDKQLFRGAVDLRLVSRQQGVIQLYKYYCLERRCAECAVGDAIGMDDAGMGKKPAGAP